MAKYLSPIWNYFENPKKEEKFVKCKLCSELKSLGSAIHDKIDATINKLASILASVLCPHCGMWMNYHG